MGDKKELLKETVESAAKFINETVKDVTEKAEPVTEKAKIYIDEAIKKAEPVTEKAKTYLDEAIKKAEPVTGKAKTYFDDAQDVISEAAKKMGFTAPEVFIQYDGKEVNTSNIVEKAKAAYIADGSKAGAIKQLKVYVKPTENAIYYVVNEDKYFGKIFLF